MYSANMDLLIHLNGWCPSTQAV